MTVEFLGLLVLLLLGSLFALVSDVDVVLMWTGMWPCCLSCSSTWLWPQGADGWSPVLSICSGWFDHLDPPTATSVLSTNNQQHSHLRPSFPALFPFCLLVSLLFPLLRWRICAQWSLVVVTRGWSFPGSLVMYQSLRSMFSSFFFLLFYSAHSAVLSLYTVLVGETCMVSV